MTTTTLHTPDAADFTEIDRHFADLLLRLEQRDDLHLWLAAALTSHHTQQGHVCLELASVAGKSFPAGESRRETLLPSLDEWVPALRNARVVGAPGEFRPLILDDAFRLYLYRYWEHESRLAAFLRKRAGRRLTDVDERKFENGLERLFQGLASGQADWQRVAAIAAVLRNLCVIAGGPGTGKTSTVVKILVLLLEQSGAKTPAIALAAPTGKAAARMKEAVKQAKSSLDASLAVVNLIPEEAFTLHRLLGTAPRSSRTRHDRDNPLPYDVIVVDEASMIDLPLMARLVEAIAESAQLILLGDRDQLASVEPGAVFGDICSAAEEAGLSSDFSTQVGKYAGADAEVAFSPTERLASQPLRDTMILLRESYRFRADSGIRQLSLAIQSQDQDRFCQLLESRSLSDLRWEAITTAALLQSHLERWVLEAYSSYLDAVNPEEAFARLGENRILCALRQGPFGVTAVNRLVEETLTRKGLIRPRGKWYKGQPILINRNDYQLRLFNGDIGIVMEDSETGDLRVRFPAEAGGFRKILPAKLPEHETVYAMTVHKAQGSEFSRVLLLVPSRSSAVLTRELFYTAVTRARNHVEIWGSLEVLRESIAQGIQRHSGLRDALSR